MSYIKKEPIIEFITKGLNNPDKTKAYGYDAIEILTEIEYSPSAEVISKKDIAEQIYQLSEECGAGVMFWRKMRAYADKLRGECE